MVSRRQALGLLAAGSTPGLLARWATPKWAPSVSKATRRFAEDALTGLDPATTIDAHVHMIGTGTGGTGCWVNPALTSGSVIERARFEIYQAAAGIGDPARSDQAYVEVLLRLARSPLHRGRLILLAFDWFRDGAGVAVREQAVFYTPNDHVLGLAVAHPDVFLAGASIHPNRPDALDELDRVTALGARLIKWLPAAQNVDPADPRHIPFYTRMAALGMPLLTHGGHESAVATGSSQRFNDPHRLRLPLSLGVRTIVAHAASYGSAERPDGRGTEPAFQQALKLLDAPGGAHLQLGLSATQTVNRCCTPLETLLGTRELHPHLVNGSDFPIPAIDPVVWLRQLSMVGLLDRADRTPLADLFEHNPLAFDQVLKRRLRVIVDGERIGFPTSAFRGPRGPLPSLPPASPDPVPPAPGVDPG